MPQSSSAVNRFDRFLKERKDSELLNLQVLKEDLDKSGNEDAADVKVGSYFVHSCIVSARCDRDTLG